LLPLPESEVCWPPEFAESESGGIMRIKEI